MAGETIRVYRDGVLVHTAPGAVDANGNFAFNVATAGWPVDPDTVITFTAEDVAGGRTESAVSTPQTIDAQAPAAGLELGTPVYVDQSAGTASSGSVTGINAAAGDLLLLGLAVPGNISIDTVTDSAGLTWTALPGTDGAAPYCNTRWYWARTTNPIAGGSVSFTLGAGAYWGAAVIPVSSANATTPVGAHTEYRNNAGGTVSSVTLSGTTAGSICLAVFCQRDDESAPTASTGCTVLHGGVAAGTYGWWFERLDGTSPGGSISIGATQVHDLYTASAIEIRA